MPRIPSTGVRLEDIADATGYSASTVGYVLRGKGDTRHIGASVQELIRRKADELGYQGNTFAKALKTGRSSIVAIIGSSNQYFWREHFQFIIARRLQELGFQPLIFDFFNGTRGHLELLRQAAALNPEGIIVSRIIPEAVTLLEALKKRGVAVIASDEIEGIEIDQVALDRFECGYAPTKALIQLGHKRIAYTVHVLPERPFEMRKRIAGHRKAIEEAGLEYSDELLIPIGVGGRLTELGRLLVHEKLSGLKQAGISAVATFDDLIAFGMIRGASELKLTLPQELSITGGGFQDNMDYLFPSLSTLVCPYENLAESLISLLMARLDGTKSSYEKIWVKPAFVMRESCAS